MKGTGEKGRMEGKGRIGRRVNAYIHACACGCVCVDAYEQVLQHMSCMCARESIHGRMHDEGTKGE